MKRQKDPIREERRRQASLLSPLKNQDSLMRLNKILANRNVLLAAAIITGILAFLLVNYLLHVLGNLKYIFQPGADPGQIIGIGNAFRLDIAQHGLFYLVVLLAIGIGEAILCYNIRVSWKDLNVGQKGTERWATPKELDEQYRSIPEKDKQFPGRGGLPVSWRGTQILIDDSEVNNLIIGPPRSGKGECFVFPLLDIYSRAEQQASLLVTDPKQELFRSSAQTLQKRGYAVYQLNLQDPARSMGYNPLTPIIQEYKAGNIDGAEMLASILGEQIYQSAEAQGENKYWDGSADKAFQALILAHIDDCLRFDQEENEQRRKTAQEEYEARRRIYLQEHDSREVRQALLVDSIQNLRRQNKTCTPEQAAELLNTPTEEIRQWWDALRVEVPVDPPHWEETHKNEKNINLFSAACVFTELNRVKLDENRTALDRYFERRPRFDPAKFAYASIESAPDRTKGSVLSVALNQIQIFTRGKIARLTADSSLNLLDIGFGKQPAAVFLAIDTMNPAYTALATLFLSQTIHTLNAHAAAGSGRCDRQVVFVLDEFGNLPKIPNIDKYITYALGVGLYFNLVIHSLGQLKALYGEQVSNSILNGCGNKVILQCGDLETAKELSSLIGDETITTLNRMGSKLDVTKSLTEMYEAKPLINPNQLMHLLEGENIVKRMKRRSLRGADVESTPIFNRGAQRFKYRYQYLTDSFPNPTEVDASALPTGDLRGVEIHKRVYDVARIFRQFERDDYDAAPIGKLRYGKQLAAYVSSRENIPLSEAKKRKTAQARQHIEDGWREGRLDESAHSTLLRLLEAGCIEQEQN